MRGRSGGVGAGYWLLAGVLAVTGMAASRSFGRPLLVLAITLLVLAPKRRDPVLFWPVVTAVATFVLMYTLIAPASCTAVPVPAGKPPLEACKSPTGIPYGGRSFGDVLPALMFASTAAVPAAFAARRGVRGRSVTPGG